VPVASAAARALRPAPALADRTGAPAPRPTARNSRAPRHRHPGRASGAAKDMPCPCAPVARRAIGHRILRRPRRLP
jgi:hypothetical protein